MLSGLKRFLRSPRTIVGEGGAVAVAGVVSTIVPQAPTPSERVGWAIAHPLASRLAGPLRLHDVFTSWWFLAIVTLAGASLAVVLVEQWRRLARELRRRPDPASFQAAPLRVEFVRPARGGSTRIASRRRIGLVGSPLFHLGLMLVILAGAARALFAADAVALLYEGERLEPRPEAFGAQWLGTLARPVALGMPVVLREVLPERYPSGRLRQIAARLAVGGAAPREEVVAVNTPIDLGRERLYLSSLHGCAAFVDVRWAGGERHELLLMDEADQREFVRTELFPGELFVRLRAVAGTRGERPQEAEVRVLRGTSLVALGTLRPGETLAVPGGGAISLVALRWWARFSATRDLSAWPAYAGFTLALLGAGLMFLVVPVEEAVIVHRDGAQETVTVALRPRRFAPLFQERLERLARDEGAPTAG